MTDTLGLLVVVVVLAASWQDRDGAKSTATGPEGAYRQSLAASQLPSARTG